MKYLLLIFGIVLLFFYQIFLGKIPFPGDLLVNENPYRTESFQNYSPGSFPTKLQGEDIITQIYPWRYFSLQQLKMGEVPFWNPYNFSGNQQLANFQTGIFYPLNFLYFILPFNTAWTVLIMLSSFLAAFFMFLFLRKSLKLSEYSSFLGAVAFAFSSYMTVWVEYGNIAHTILWLPLVLLFTKRIYQKATALNLVSLVFILTLSILAGYIQGVFYICLISFFYFLFLLKISKPKEKIKKTILFMAAFVLPFLIASFQILPTVHFFLNSTRGQYSIAQISNLLLPIHYWLTGFASDFFGNPAVRNYWIQGTYIERVMYVGVSFLLFAFVAVKVKIAERKFFLFFAIASLLAASNLPLIKFLYLLPIPVISTTVPTRELSLFIFSMVVLGAIGIDHWEKNKFKTKIPFIFLLIYALILMVVIIFWKLNVLSYKNFIITLRNLFLPSIFAVSTVIIFYFFPKKAIGKILLAILVIFDLLYFFSKITPFSKEEFIYPKTAVITYLAENAGINRFWGYGSAYIKPNFQTYDKTYSPEGNDPLYIETYGALLASSSNGKIPDVLPRQDANIAPGYGSQLADNFYRKRILDLLGVKYILHQNSTENYDETLPKDKYKLSYTKIPWQIYENKGAFPRFFITNDYRVYKNKSEILKNIYDKNLDLKKVLLLEREPDISIDKDSKGSATLLSYKPNKVVFSTQTSGNSLLFLSDNYSPQWRALIDGKDSKVLIADYSFRAISLPKGVHTVEFFYSSIYLLLGAKISLIALFFLLMFVFWIKKHEKV